jgi:hypothetical protein
MKRAFETCPVCAKVGGAAGGGGERDRWSKSGQGG